MDKERKESGEGEERKGIRRRKEGDKKRKKGDKKRRGSGSSESKSKN